MTPSPAGDGIKPPGGEDCSFSTEMCLIQCAVRAPGMGNASRKGRNKMPGGNFFPIPSPPFKGNPLPCSLPLVQAIRFARGEGKDYFRFGFFLICSSLMKSGNNWVSVG